MKPNDFSVVIKRGTEQNRSFPDPTRRELKQSSRKEAIRKKKKRGEHTAHENLETVVGKEEEEKEAHEVPGTYGAEAVAEVDEDEPHAARREDDLPVGLERDLRPEQVHGCGVGLRPHSPRAGDWLERSVGSS